MIYLLLFGLEVLALWFLSRKVTGYLMEILPTSLFVLVFLPGTLIHELSHFLMATILFVRVGKFTLIPQKHEKEIVLGSVAIEKKDIFRRLLIGAAPIIFGLLIVLTTVYVTFTQNIYRDWKIAIAISYVVFVIGNTMFSSKRDLEGAWKVGVVLVAIVSALYVLGVRITFDSDFRLVRLVSLYLLVPIAIDAAILSALSLRRRPRLKRSFREMGRCP